MSSTSRSERLDAYLTQIPLADLLYIRRHATRIVLQRAASFQELPPEVVGLIAQYVTPNEVLCYRLVSKGWFTSWWHLHITTQLCRLHYPGLLELHAESLLQPGELLLEAMRKIKVKNRVLSQMNIITKNDVSELMPWHSRVLDQELPDWQERLMPPPMTSVLYGQGKMAWKTTSGVVVCDLTSRARKLLKTGNAILSGSQTHLIALTNKLLITAPSARSSISLHVRHLDFDQSKRLSLPSGCQKCSAQNESIVILTTTGQILTWAWQGKLMELATKHKLAKKSAHYDLLRGWNHPGVMFHPTRPEVLYLAWVYNTVLPPLDEGHKSESHYSFKACAVHMTTIVIKYEHGKVTNQFCKVVTEPICKVSHNTGKVDYRSKDEIEEPQDEPDAEEEEEEEQEETDSEEQNQRYWDAKKHKGEMQIRHPPSAGEEALRHRGRRNYRYSNLSYPDSRVPYKWYSSVRCPLTQCQSVNAHGLHVLAAADTPVTERASVCFNVLTEDFTCFEYSDWKLFVDSWGEVLMPYNSENEMKKVIFCQDAVVEVRICSPSTFGSNPYVELKQYSASRVDGKVVRRGGESWYRRSVVADPVTAFMDEDFVVVVAGEGFYVWRFQI
ncbi:hypothetical protein S40293_03282 [Stachybotrys chartarum IBT 40293]|nr:hypothetical protein S40293_03282 [Stachybotrys chartarum IBT 40293]